MIQRYTNPEMGAIWSDQRRYETWLEVELAAVDAMAETGLVPRDAAAELRRAKDHLKGSLMLSLENTASRMSHLARQEIYFERHFGLDETLAGVERVSAEDVRRVAADLFADGSLAATIVGPRQQDVTRAQLDLG